MSDERHGPKWCPRDPDTGEPYHECLWRIAGYDIAARKHVLLVGLVRAPDRDTALVIAVQRYSKTHRDLSVRGEPIIDRHYRA